jgi:hypothetical protein
MGITNYGPYGVSINYRARPGHGNQIEKLLNDAFGALKSSRYKDFHVVTYRNWAGPVAYYHAFIPFAKFADLDAWPAAGGGEHESALQNSGAASVLGSDSAFLELVPELSNPPAGGPAPYVVALTYRLKPGAADDFEAAGKSLRAKSGPSALVYRSFAGTTDAYHVAVPFNKFADLDAWQSDAGALGGDAIEDVDISFAEYVPALSNPV